MTNINTKMESFNKNNIPEILIIGKKGLTDKPIDSDPVVKNKKVNLGSTLKLKERQEKSKEKSQFLYKPNKKSEITEISVTDLGKEIISDDYQYFVAFCSLAYLMRGIYLIYLVTKSIDNKTPNNTVFITITMIFGIICIATSITGFIFSWLMYLAFFIPFAICLAFSTLHILFKLFKTTLFDFAKCMHSFKSLSLSPIQ